MLLIILVSLVCKLIVQNAENLFIIESIINGFFIRKIILIYYFSLFSKMCKVEKIFKYLNINVFLLKYHKRNILALKRWALI